MTLLNTGSCLGMVFLGILPSQQMECFIGIQHAVVAERWKKKSPPVCPMSRDTDPANIMSISDEHFKQEMSF